MTVQPAQQMVRKHIYIDGKLVVGDVHKEYQIGQIIDLGHQKIECVSKEQNGNTLIQYFEDKNKKKS